jgi:hypothetical protein
MLPVGSVIDRPPPIVHQLLDQVDLAQVDLARRGCERRVAHGACRSHRLSALSGRRCANRRDPAAVDLFPRRVGRRDRAVRGRRAPAGARHRARGLWSGLDRVRTLREAARGMADAPPAARSRTARGTAAAPPAAMS